MLADEGARMNETQTLLFQLGVALAIGLLVGVERGWQERSAEEGGRVAGVRTYGLVGLLGGVSALLGTHFGALLIGLLFIGLAIVLGIAHRLQQAEDDDAGVTSLVAALLTFVLGALAVHGETLVAVACAVVATLLLNQKPLLHRWVNALRPEELRAGIKLLLISAVMLPVLPNARYGPWEALNPYAIWWMVVLIAAISFVGYFAVKLGGARNGVLFTGLFGGLASSTATTLHFARLGRREPGMAPALAAGILLACGTMMPRMLLVASVLNPALFAMLLPPVLAMALVSYAPVVFYLRRKPDDEHGMSSPVDNPLELRTALTFGALLALVMLLGRALQDYFGDAGVLVLAAVSGITDVDAIVLSLARMSQDDLGMRVAVTGMVIAAAANNLTKGAMASAIAGRPVALRAGLPLFASAAVGLGVQWWRF
jgi:uncharacterized membrane protein (DUF4010 family)